MLYKSLKSFIVTHVLRNSCPNALHHKYNPLSGELPSVFTMSENPFGAGYVMQMEKNALVYKSCTMVNKF